MVWWLWLWLWYPWGGAGPRPVDIRARVDDTRGAGAGASGAAPAGGVRGRSPGHGQRRMMMLDYHTDVRGKRDATDKRSFRELVRTEHYEEERGEGRAKGHGVRFHYADGHVADFPPHKQAGG